MKSNVTVKVFTDYVIQDQTEIQKILKNVSKVISGSYQRKVIKGEAV